MLAMRKKTENVCYSHLLTSFYIGGVWKVVAGECEVWMR